MKIRTCHVPALALALLAILTPTTIPSACEPTHDAVIMNFAPQTAEGNAVESGSTGVDITEKRSRASIVALDTYFEACVTVVKAIWTALHTVVASLVRVVLQALVAIVLGLVRLLLLI